MRVTSPPDVQGYWWLPGKENNKLPGRLLVSEAGNVSLHLLGIFDDGMYYNARKIPIIHGITEGGKRATLVDCYYKNRRFRTPGIDSAEVCAILLLLGFHFDSDDELKFSKVSFHLEGLDEWLSISGILIEHDFEKQAATISYNPINPINYSIENDISFSIQFGWTIPLVGGETEAKITQRASLNLEYSEPTSLSDIRANVYKINNLICLALNTPVAVTSFSVSNPSLTNEINGKKKTPIKIDVYYPSIPHPDNPPKISWGRILFTYKDISEEFAFILSSWLRKYIILEPAFNLFFASSTTKHTFIETKFLLLIQGLETLHRRIDNKTVMPVDEFNSLVKIINNICPKKFAKWLEEKLKYANEISLRRRFDDLISPFIQHFGGKKKVKTFINDVVNTRNYLTHYDVNLEESAKEKLDLHVICQKLEVLFGLQLISQSGFSQAQIDNFVYRSYEKLEIEKYIQI